MKKETVSCDFCQKELGSASTQMPAISIVVQAVQGVRPEVYDYVKNKIPWMEQKTWYGSYPSWKHRDVFGFIVCEDCCGEKVKINHGDDGRFSLSNACKTLLRKIGFLNPNPLNGAEK